MEKLADAVARVVVKLLDVGKIPLQLILLLVAVSGFLVLSPESWIKAIGLPIIRAQSWFWAVSAVLLVFGALLLIRVLLFLLMPARILVERGMARRRAIAELKKLDPSEKALLRRFYLSNRNTLDLPINDPVVAGLLAKRILSTTGGIGRYEMANMTTLHVVMSVEINPYVRDLIAPKLLDLQ